MKIKYGQGEVELDFEEFVTLQSCGMLDGITELLTDLESANTECSCISKDNGFEEDEILEVLKHFFKDEHGKE
ncbi:MAG TPA: hypothetical protein VK190_02905 [Pseudoneobacillus sp.]|nr:hypothetical protein [Pseudoneobacillus sp.]